MENPVFFILGFSLLKTKHSVHLFETKIHLQVEAEYYTKKHLSATIEVSKPLL